MKKILKFALIAVLALGSHSCDDWMNVIPEGEPIIDDAFTNRANAERFLFTVYHYLPLFGDLGSVSFFAGDEFWSLNPGFGNYNTQLTQAITTGRYPRDISRGFQGTTAPFLNFWDGGGLGGPAARGGRPLWRGIRDAHIFLENIHLPLDLSHFDRMRWTAEATFLKAYYHFYLLKLYGAIPIMREPIDVGAPIEEVRVFRDPVSDVVEYIVELLDGILAMPIGLPLTIEDPINEAGRITKPIAAAVRAQVLLFYASPLMNGNPYFANIVDSRGVYLFPRTFDPDRWTRAAEAAREAIDIAHEAGHRLFHFVEPMLISETSRRQLSIRGAVTEQWMLNTELIWGETRRHLNGGRQGIEVVSTARPFIPALGGQVRGAPATGNGTLSSLSPTLDIAEMFHSSTGVPLDECLVWADDFENRFTITTIPDEGNNRYLLHIGERTAKLHLNREPRFYANLTFGRSLEAKAQTLVEGNPQETLWRYNLLAGTIGGNMGGESFSMTGYVTRTTSNIRANIAGTPGTMSSPGHHFPIIRLADLYLMYAEALNESLPAPNAEVWYYVDKVRARAGLNRVVDSWEQYSRFPHRPLTQDGMREIIRRERLIELSGEGKRFWDMRRWRIHRAEEIRGWNAAFGRTPEDFYQVMVHYVRPRQTVRDFLWPISTHALIRNPNLVQNPGW